MSSASASSFPKALEKAGVVGAGGGGFPSHVKASSPVDIVIANGAECEPLARADGELMRTDAARVVEGLSLLREAVGASRAIVAVKPRNAEYMRAALPKDTDVDLAILDNVYPSGDEFLLVFDLTERVVPEEGIPPDVGVVVNNVTTLAQGADAALGKPVTNRMVTVQGEVSKPGTFVTPIGTPITELLAVAGGTTVPDPAIVVGGPMMGRVAENGDDPLTKTDGCLVVLPEGHRLVSARRTDEAAALRLARAACCQCLACTELCPRALLGHDLAPHRTVRAIQYDTIDVDHRHITSAYLCCECGMCELFACPLEIQPRMILAGLKRELKRRGVENPHTRKDLSPDAVREYRQIPTDRLTARLGLASYDHPAPLADEGPEPSRVVLRMAQHVGEAATPVVQRGDRVLEGDLVGEIPEGRLGARVHASISGTVESVSEQEIVVARG